MTTETIKASKTLTGQVVSNRMDKTVSVRIDRLVKHPLYGKFVRRSTKVLAHDESNECQEGDTVVIEQSRPQSKHKAWRLVEIITRAEKV
ncbi:MAG: 30S ribosomal protein S17 [Gammaproteobacteria bacterium]|nr:30S ribosomal protein S17 [Gammaproteobacteria bacterium]